MKTIASMTIALATLGLAVTPAQADSTEHHSWEWPLYEPARNSSGQVVRGRPRRLVLSSLGEADPDWTHPGIDIMGNHINHTTRSGQDDDLPDVTVIPVDSELIWVFNRAECGARIPDAGKSYRCRLWFRTQDKKYLYYFGHVHYNHTAVAGDVEVNSHLRDAIIHSLASSSVSGGQSCDSANPSDCQFGRGALGPTLSGWDNGFDHLHFDIVDPNQDYDLVNPLTYLKPTATSQAGMQFDVTDNVRPTLVAVDFVPDAPDVEPSNDDPNGTKASMATPGDCGLEINGKVDIMAVAYDDFRMWEAENNEGALPIAYPFNATTKKNHIGLYKATYSVKKVGEDSARQSGTWYTFDSAPLFCPGPLKGTLCPFGSDRLTIDGGTNDEGLFDRFQPDQGSRALADWPNWGYGNRLYRYTLFTSSGWPQDDEHIPLILTNESGTEEGYYGGQQSGYTTQTSWDTTATWDTTDQPRFPDGRYQVDVVVFDNEEQHRAGRSVLINVHNNSSSPLDTEDTAFRDIYIADSDGDVGAVPSSVGDQPYWSSPDILVVRADMDNPPQGPHNTQYRVDQILPGVDYHVWVQVHHAVCKSIHHVKLRLAHADPSTFNKPEKWALAPITSGFQGPPGKPDGETLDAGSDKQWVGPFDWTPEQDDLGAYGHRCLLAAVESEFETTSEDDMKHVPERNNVAQRNVEIGQSMKFIFSNPFAEASEVGLRLSASKGMNCYYKLSLAFDSTIFNAWSGASQDVGVAHVGTKLEATIKARDVVLPPALLPGYAEKEITASVDCQYDVDFMVDVESTVNGQSYGGMALHLVMNYIP